MARRLGYSLVVLLALASGTLGPWSTTPARATPPDRLQYVTVDDGTEIAVGLIFPPGYQPGKRYPALVEMEGYGGAQTPNDQTFIGDPDYAVVAISVRGTGCSGGQLDLFSDRSSRDGAYIIDHWIPDQPWSNGKVGIYGHSYSGLTGFLVAAQHPEHLVATAVSGLIDDFYRGILYPGGVPNPGFPILWGLVVRPRNELQGNLTPLQNDPECQRNFAQHQGSDLLAYQTALEIYTQPQATPDSWAIQRALLGHSAGIDRPIQIGQQYQDEQTGPRGGFVLYQHIPPGVPKRFVVSTGRHSPADPTGTKRDWLDCWILGGPTSSLGHPCSQVLDPSRRVLAFFESEGSDRLAPYVSADWPFPETDWERYYLGADGSLAPTPHDGAVLYASPGTGRQLTGDLGGLTGVDPTGIVSHAGLPTAGQLTYASGLPDTARFLLPFSQTTAVAGPLDLTLWATATSTDFDVFAEVLDLDLSSGQETFVQRGLLRASFREVAPELSDTVPSGPHQGEIYRPYHPFVNPTPILPGQAYRYEVEIFPLGHVFRAGHALVLQVHAPPANDPISTYLYEPNQPSVVTILQDPVHRSSLLLPLLVTLPPIRSTPPGCGQVTGEICVTPVAG